jgi:DNA helicase-2/ATP-dependent DNA helicase PcrA
MPIRKEKYNTEVEQYFGVVQHIKKLIESGEHPGEIAVISRKHKTLENLTPLLGVEKIPYYYEKSNNVLEDYHISQIITIARFCNDLGTQAQGDSDYLLPEILSYPFWGLHHITTWEIARNSRKEKMTWYDYLKNSEVTEHPEDNEKLKKIFTLFQRISNEAKNQTAENVIDQIVGSQTSVPDDEHDDSEEIVVTEEVLSPFKAYYFDSELQKSLSGNITALGDGSYLSLLSSLRVLIQAVRSHKNKHNFKLADFIEFVDLLETNRIQLSDKQVFNNKSSAVNLISAHKSKGLEFKHVFVINVVRSEWEKGGRSNKISFPGNIPLLPDKDTNDDKVRLFFVAITRAKTNLFLTSYAQSEEGKEVDEVSFQDFEWEEIELDEEGKERMLSIVVHDNNDTVELTSSHMSILQDMVEDYKLSVTHLINYLNVINGGPLQFLETNLLRFPQAKNPSASYGSAVHNALNVMYIEFKRNKSIPSKEFLLDQFKIYLQSEGLNKSDYEDAEKKGIKYLSEYYNQRHEIFSMDSIVERDFKAYNVHIGDAHITGKLDKMDIDYENRTILVTDYKTGKPLNAWKQSDATKKEKSWKYELQLIFYKLLVEHSSEFGGKYEVNQGALEFIEYERDSKKIIVLDKQITQEEAENLRKLIQVVYNKIINLDFPDTSEYSQNMKGVQEFISNLLD